MQVKTIIAWFLSFLSLFLFVASLWQPSLVSEEWGYLLILLIVPLFLIVSFYLTFRSGSYPAGTIMALFGVILFHIVYSIAKAGFTFDLLQTFPVFFGVTIFSLGIISIMKKVMTTKNLTNNHHKIILPIIGIVLISPLLITWYEENKPTPYYSPNNISNAKLYEIADSLDQVQFFKEKYPSYGANGDRNGHLAVEYAYYPEDHKYDNIRAYVKLIVVFSEAQNPENIVLYCTNNDLTESASKSEIVDYLKQGDCFD